MAIQIPDAGTGNGATGDNEFVLWTKVINNFSDQTHAASKIVGKETGKLVLFEDIYEAAFSIPAIDKSLAGSMPDVNSLPPNGKYMVSTTTLNAPPSKVRQIAYIEEKAVFGSTSAYQLGITYGAGNELFFRNKFTSTWRPWVEVWHTGNTTKDANGFLKGASPIVKVFADKVELNDDAVNQSVSYKKNGIGDYTITTVSGLSTDGWYIELPKDMNGNPKVAVTLEETNGVISLKTYKRIFSMETFTFEPDLEQPLDIPDGRWIDLRLNEIPFEAQEELPTDGG